MILYTASVQDISQRSDNGILTTNETPSRDFGLYLYIYIYIY